MSFGGWALHLPEQPFHLDGSNCWKVLPHIVPMYLQSILAVVLACPGLLTPASPISPFCIPLLAYPPPPD